MPRGLSAVAVAAAILASTPAAVADPAPPGGGPVLPGDVIVTSSKEVVKSPKDSISCSVLAGPAPDIDPKPPTGPVFAHAGVLCTAPVEEIGMLFNIYKDGQLIASRLLSNKGKGSISALDSPPCEPGTYTVKAEALVTFPPEFVPHWATASKTSYEKQITC